jgi:hypothetical protein
MSRDPGPLLVDFQSRLSNPTVQRQSQNALRELWAYIPIEAVPVGRIKIAFPKPHPCLQYAPS